MSEEGGRDGFSGGRFGRRRMLQLTGISTLGSLVVDTAAGMEDEADEVDEDGGAEAESAHQVTVSGPSSVEVGRSYRFQAGGYEGWGNYEYSWSSSGTISGDGKSVTITFDSEGAHWVSVSVFDLDQGVPLGGDEMDVEVVSEEVEMELEGPAEIVMDRPATFTAHPDPGDAAFARIDWDVLYVNDDEFDVSTDDDGLTAEIEFYTEGTRTVRVEYETDQGYRDSETTLLEVVDLDWYVNKKLALSDEVTRLSASIDERQQVEPVLQSIEQRARDGVVAPTTARDAINRMRLAEDVTEKAFAGFGPRVARSPEENLVGEPADSLPAQSEYEHPLGLRADVNLTGETMGSFGWFFIGLLTGKKFFAKLAKKFGIIDEITMGKAMIADVLTAAGSFFPTVINTSYYESAKRYADELISFIESEDEDSEESLVNFVGSRVKKIRDDFGDALLEQFEQHGGRFFLSSFNDHLRNVDDEMSGGESGNSELQGTQSGAKLAAERGGERTINSIENGLKSITSIDIVSLMGGLITMIAGALVAGGITAPVAAGVAIVGLLLTLTAEFLAMTAAFIQMYTIREIHENALDAIITGEGWV